MLAPHPQKKGAQRNILVFPGGSDGKVSAYNVGDRFDPWVGKILWRRKWQPTPVLLPGKSHGWRSLVGYSLWGRKELDTTERLHSLTSLTKESTNDKRLKSQG